MISVIIPAFNRATVLPVTLRSLLAQSLPAGEIIVVDDGSSDGTAEVAESFGDPVRVIRQENAGPAAARNRGFMESKGEFIHFFDSDDVALPNKHKIQQEVLEETGADIAYGPWVKGRFVDNDFVCENLVLQQKGLPQGDLVKALLANWSVVPHACLFRRRIVERSGGFPGDLFVAEDQMMFLNCLLIGAKVVHSPGTLELYRSDNQDKITDTSLALGRRRHVVNWAKFLLMANERCRLANVYPSSWFGFRRRVWNVLRELDEEDLTEFDPEKRLSALGGGSFLSGIFPLSLLGQRVRQGIEVRMGRGRAHPCFRVGEMDQAQRAALQDWERNEAEVH